jgi:DNA repair protein RadA/Sms
MGFCPQCRESGGLVAVGPAETAASPAVPLRDIPAGAAPRRATGIDEIDRVLGGGLVSGSTVLVGGEPGVGKSTLLLQVAARAAGAATVMLVSAEESPGQVAIRAERLGIAGTGLLVTAHDDVESIIAEAARVRPDLLVVDSVQTVATREADAGRGSVVQVRESAARFIAFAKRTGTAVLLVGHVTKEGSIAGPKILEHMVDVVLYLEGEGDGGLRLLRSLKNRYGSVNQVGVFEMRDDGMAEVGDPSGVLVAAHRPGAAGTILFPAVEGRRSMLVEVQALVVRSNLPHPRRSVKGLDASRLHQLLAVIERHGDLPFGNLDVHVNVVGGLRVRDPAIDLPAALAVISSYVGRPLPLTAAWGEVGLTGEIRPAGHGERRLAEARRFEPTLVVRPGSEGVGTLVEARLAAGLGGGRPRPARLGSVPRPGG